MPIIKPAQIRKYNTKTVQVHENKTLNRQNNNDMSGKSKNKTGTWKKPYPLKKQGDLKMPQISAEPVLKK
jgi:hypothetical protein